YPVELGKLYLAPALVEPAHLDSLGKAQHSRGTTLPLALRITGQSEPAALEREVQLGKHLLGRLCRQLSQPVELRTQPGELAALADLARALTASPAALVKRDVPQQPHTARPPAKCLRLI